AKAATAAKGAPAVGALDSDEHPSLTAGTYVVYSGIFDDEKAAKTALSRLRAKFAQARVVRVATSSSPASSPSSSGGDAPSAPGQPKTGEPSSAPQSTKKAFEESKRAPKTVGTGGKPPPKDNKAPAAGGDFEEIE
ncbi:MAG: hypothetical protein H0W96_14430, partial [Solirubrobacterales bacterium]|nr:hypothetical protein [Solirubrobacterales bacterium]